jgi:hypothetical protein
MKLKHAVLNAISFVFHPLIMPLLGVIFYFSKSPRYIPEPVIKAKIIALVILTVVLPILIYYLLKTVGLVHTVFLKTTKERIRPLMINCFVILLVLKYILPSNEIIELHYFFVAILLSTLTCLILAFLKFKASIHMIAVSGLFMFFIALSIHFSKNVIGTLALFSLVIGAVATSRLHLKAHTNIELVIGFFIGVIPQLLILNYWL